MRGLSKGPGARGGGASESGVCCGGLPSSKTWSIGSPEGCPPESLPRRVTRRPGNARPCGHDVRSQAGGEGEQGSSGRDLSGGALRHRPRETARRRQETGTPQAKKEAEHRQRRSRDRDTDAQHGRQR